MFNFLFLTGESSFCSTNFFFSSICKGNTMLIENLDEEIEPVLDPLLGRVLIKKGKSIRLGDKEIEYHANFRLYLHTKLANPHYKPGLIYIIEGLTVKTHLDKLFGLEK